jgi:coenzyme F420-reducing hydrogenase alpha subunit
MKTKTIKVDYLARVEGEGALLVKMNENAVTDVQFRIFEPPRFFEAFLRGRRFTEAPDITARICGICPVAYQMSSVQAMEHAFGATIPEPIKKLRRLLYCGEWIESHALHIYMLHAPDFLGYQDAIQLANDHPEIVKKGLLLKKIGNSLMTTIGGREIHPINVRVGGFYRAPDKTDLAPFEEKLMVASDIAAETVRFVSGLSFPDFEQEYEFVALRHPNEYAINEGRLVSNRGLDIDVAQYDNHFAEEHIPYANALHSYRKGGGAYHVGPLARFNLNFDKLTGRAAALAREVGCVPPLQNPFKSIIARAIETLYVCEEALRIVQQYTPPEKSFIELTPKASTGYGCSEAPRGILLHRYTLDDAGIILDAKIVPPTAQNQKTIENDIRAFVTKRLETPIDKLTWECEQAIRNYDPCISCATHFLKVKIEKS